MTNVISASNLGKRYTIHHFARPRYTSLRESISDGARALFRRALDGGRQTDLLGDEDFWALKDVNFSIAQGERLGIVGRNGAGKSTLLKILSRITEPTEGRVEIRGRIASLLEIGTGFHPELTGRENIFLNGAILGMSARDIRQKFDAIVAFAETERFLDTPVKRYSSGMYVRLAFAVAAHLEPDILVVDEVLAVGDAQFQKKCLGKMEEVTGAGRTVVFVSHNMTTITSLCTSCMLLEEGRVLSVGDPLHVTSKYYERGYSGRGAELIPGPDTPGASSEVARLRRARLVDRERKPIDYVLRKQKVGIEIYYDIFEGGHSFVPNVHVFSHGQCAFVSAATGSSPVRPGSYVSLVWIPENFLNEGLYTVGLALSSMNPVRAFFYVQEGIMFNVLDDLNDPSRNEYALPLPGLVRPTLEWSTESVTGHVSTQ